MTSDEINYDGNSVLAPENEVEVIKLLEADSRLNDAKEQENES